MAWASRRPSGKWQGLYRLPDGSRRSAGVFTHKPAALREANRLESEAQDLGWRDPRAGARPWGEWVEHWQPTRSVSARTRDNDANLIKNHLRPRWAGVDLIDITRQEVRAWAATLAEQGLSASTVRNCVRVLSASISAAADAEILPSNPLHRLGLPPVAPAADVYLTRGEYAAVREHLDHDARDLADFLVTTGARWGEAAGLHTHRLHGSVVQIAESLNSVHRTIEQLPKGQRTRDVPLPRETQLLVESRATIECVVEHPRGTCRGRLVFSNEWGRAWDISVFRRQWTAAVEYAGVRKVRVHDLRHTYASWMLQAGISLAEVGRLLGHVSPQTTQRYAHLAPPDQSQIRAAASWSGGKTGGNENKHEPSRNVIPKHLDRSDSLILLESSDSIVIDR